MFRIINRYLTQFGIDLRKTLYGFKSILFFFKDFLYFKFNSDKSFPVEASYPCLADKFDTAGKLDSHYFFQDIYVSRKIYDANPIDHLDVGSRIDGFIAQLSVFRKLTIIDIRPLDIEIENVIFLQADICKDDFNLRTAESVSCLHTLEHIGLGRYNDPLGTELWKKGLKNIWSLVKPGGVLYLSVPIGRQRIMFNAHRVFNSTTIINEIKNGKLIDFAFIGDKTSLQLGPTNTQEIDNLTKQFNYGLGIFTFKKNIN
jgi:hypothetical protein